MVAALNDAQVDWVLLLGYMKKWAMESFASTAVESSTLIQHCCLLSAAKASSDARYTRRYAAGVLESGATLHLVGSEYDTGPIIAQIKSLCPIR